MCYFMKDVFLRRQHFSRKVNEVRELWPLSSSVDELRKFARVKA